MYSDESTLIVLSERQFSLLVGIPLPHFRWIDSGVASFIQPIIHLAIKIKITAAADFFLPFLCLLTYIYEIDGGN